jgi:hypothetical protein
MITPWISWVMAKVKWHARYNTLMRKGRKKLEKQVNVKTINERIAK